MNLTLSLDNNFFLFELNGATTWVPRLNGVPDLSHLSELYRDETQTALTEWLLAGNVIPVPVPLPIVLQPDWIGLNNTCLGGVLNNMYNRLTAACFVDPATATIAQLSNANNIAVGKGLLDQSVAVTKMEGAVKASIDLILTTSNYTFTDDEKLLWNEVVTNLDFSSLIYI
jgi:hypothetical protein